MMIPDDDVMMMMIIIIMMIIMTMIQDSTSRDSAPAALLTRVPMSTSWTTQVAEFEERFARFQGQSSNVLVEYVPSDFVVGAADELSVLQHIFTREGQAGGTVAAGSTLDAELDAQLEAQLAGGADGSASSGDELDADAGSRRRQQAGGGGAAVDPAPMVECAAGGSGDAIDGGGFNVLVDLCGIFKRSSIHEVRDLVLKHYGPDRFHYVYHIDQSDSSDRVLSINSDNDVQVRHCLCLAVPLPSQLRQCPPLRCCSSTRSSTSTSARPTAPVCASGSFSSWTTAT